MEFDDFLSENPEALFSVYTHCQVSTVLKMGDEIKTGLDAIFLKDGHIAGNVNEVYGKFWLWVLGAYEIIRTMTQANDCFSEDAKDSLKRIKKPLSRLRIPFAKQELQGKKQRPIQNEASISSFDPLKRDMAFSVGNEVFWTRNLINDFSVLFKDLKVSDVVKNHRNSNKY